MGGSSKLTASALAGILAVGMIPAAAFADDAADDTTADVAAEEVVAEEASIELAAEEEAAIELEDTAEEQVTGGTISLIVHGGSPLSAVNKVITGYTQDAVDNGFDVATFVTKDTTGSFNTAALKTAAWTVTWAKADGTVIAEGPELAAGAITEAGSYKVTVTAGATSGYTGSKTLEFAVVGVAFDSALTAFDFDEDGSITADISSGNESTYSTEPVNLGFAKSDGAGLLKEGEDYTVKYFKAGQDVTKDTPLASAPTDKGDYVAYLTGTGLYSGSTKSVAFKIKPYTIASANEVEIDDIYGSADLPKAPKKVNGSEELAKHFELVYTADTTVTQNSVTKAVGEAGVYAGVTIQPKGYVSAANPGDPNVAVGGTPTVTVGFTKFAAQPVINYGGKALDGQELTVDLSKDAKFDVTKITVTDGEDAIPANTGVVHYTVAVQKSTDGGKTWTDDNGATPAVAWTTTNAADDSGLWKVTVTVTDSANVIGGKASMTVKNAAAAIDAKANLQLRVDGKAVDAGDITVVYESGRDYKTYASAGYGYVDATKSGISGVIKAKNGAGADVTLNLGSAATLSFKKDGKAVTGTLADAGTYDVTIEADGYELTNNTFKLVIKPIEITEFKLTNYEKYIVAGKNALPLDSDRSNDSGASGKQVDGYDLITGTTPVDKDGKAVVDKAELKLRYAYDANNDGKITDGTEKPVIGNEWNDIASLVQAVITKDGKVAEIKEAGTYQIELKLTDAEAKKGNYAISAKPLTVVVAADQSFVDVANDSWAKDYIDGINDNGWMTGYSDGTHFGPKDNMKRGDVCLVMYRMATGTDGKDIPNAPENTFTDVKAGSYWEKAIAWAADAGIVTGYSGKDAGKFGPGDNVTREQFVLMMSRYAKYQNVATASDGKAMATKKDPQKVSSWAKDAVAWGVDEDMIGSNGTINPQGKIKREEIAKMVMVFSGAHIGATKAVAKEEAAATYTVTTNAATVAPAATPASGQGVVKASAEKAAAGEKVTITATPAFTGQKAVIKVVAADGSLSTTSVKADATAEQTVTLEFTMPASNVNVTVTFEV